MNMRIVGPRRSERSERQPRVAVLLHDFALGGAERAVLGQVRAMQQRGVELQLWMMRADGPLLPEVPPGVSVRTVLPQASWLTQSYFRIRRPTRPLCGDLLHGRLPRTLRSVPRLVRLIREWQPDGLLATLPLNNVAAVLAGRLSGTGVRVVIREAAHRSNDQRPTGGRLDPRMPAMVRELYPWATAILCVSQGVADDLASAFSVRRELLHVVYNPVDLERIHALAQEKLDDPWLHRAQPEVPVLLAAGRLAPQKDHATLLHAFARLREQRPARLILLGEGPERPALERLASQLGIQADVRMPGAELNPYRYMARASGFVLSSRYEGFPNVILEALACGCPVVSTDCPSGPAEQLAGGTYGRLVPVADDRALACAMVALLDDPTPAALAQARARHFSVEESAVHYMDLLLGRPADTPGEPGEPGEDGPYRSAPGAACRSREKRW